MEEAGMEFLLDAADRFPLVEEFAASIEQPDPVPLARMQANEPSYAGSAVSKDDSGCGQQIGEVEVNGRHPAARRRTATSPTRSAQSTDKVNPGAPGWTKRADRTPCPSGMSALEESMRKYAEEPTKNVVRLTLGLTFDSLGEAYDFYNLYSWETGFGIRYGKSQLNVKRTKCMQEIVCGCSGKPEAENSRSCTCECPALIRLLRAADNAGTLQNTDRAIIIRCR